MKKEKLNQSKIEKLTKQLENLKKQSYSSMKLRNQNQMMNRFNRIQDEEFVRKITLKQKELKHNFQKQNRLNEKGFSRSFLNEESDETKDILDMFGIEKKKKVQMNRGGFWNLLR